MGSVDLFDAFIDFAKTSGNTGFIDNTERALYAAVTGNKGEIVALLFRSGFDFTDPVSANDCIACGGCFQVLPFACYYNLADAVAAAGFLSSEAYGTSAAGSALHFACLGGSYETAKLLLEAKVDANRYDPQGRYTPLCLAAYKGHAELVELLIAHGADIEKSIIYLDRSADAFEMLNFFKQLREAVDQLIEGHPIKQAFAKSRTTTQSVFDVIRQDGQNPFIAQPVAMAVFQRFTAMFARQLASDADAAQLAASGVFQAGVVAATAAEVGPADSSTLSSG